MFLHSVHEYEFLFYLCERMQKATSIIPVDFKSFKTCLHHQIIFSDGLWVSEIGFLRSMGVTGLMQDEHGFPSFLPFLMKFQTSYENGKTLTLET